MPTERYGLAQVVGKHLRYLRAQTTIMVAHAGALVAASGGNQFHVPRMVIRSNHPHLLLLCSLLEHKNAQAYNSSRMKSKMWTELANSLGVPWRSAEAMHWMLGADEMAQRANAVPFSLGASGSANQALSSSSSTPVLDPGYGAYDPSEAHSFTAVNEPRSSYERGFEVTTAPAPVSEEFEAVDRRQRRRPVSATFPVQGQRLAPLGQRPEQAGTLGLPSLAEVKRGVEAYAGFVGEQQRYGEAAQTFHGRVHSRQAYHETAPSGREGVSRQPVEREGQPILVKRETRESQESEEKEEQQTQAEVGARRQ